MHPAINVRAGLRKLLSSRIQFQNPEIQLQPNVAEAKGRPVTAK